MEIVTGLAMFLLAFGPDLVTDRSPGSTRRFYRRYLLAALAGVLLLLWLS